MTSNLANEVPSSTGADDNNDFLRAPESGRGSRGKTGHKGRGASSRRQENFRYRKNLETVRNVREELFAKFMLIKASPAATIKNQARVALNNRIVGSTVEHPARIVPIRTSGFRTLLEPVIEVLRNMKCDPTDAEIVSLYYVSSLQISAKLFYSQIGYGSVTIWQQANFNLYQNVAGCLAETLRPLAIYISCIGNFSMNNQVNIPSICDDSPLNNLQSQHIFENYQLIRQDSPVGEQLRQWNRLHHCLDDPLLTSLPDGLIAFDHSQLVQSYKSLISKVIRRNSDAVVVLDLKTGTGSAVQLVGSSYEHGEIKCNSIYSIDQGDLALGGLFAFGRADNFNGYPSPLHRPDLATQVVRVPEPGWAQEFCMCLYRTGT